jgi:hypothetical protein
MRRFYVEVACHMSADDLEAALDMLMDALLDEPGLLDADFSSELETGNVTIGTGIDAEDEPAALRTALVGIRSAAHKAGAGTPGWEADMERVTASVRPMEYVNC